MREALFPSVSGLNPMSVLRPSSVRIIITFCEEDLRVVLVRMIVNTGSLKLQLLREALFPSGSEEKLMSVLRSSFVLKKIIDFCEGDLEGVTRLLSTGSLNL